MIFKEVNEMEKISSQIIEVQEIVFKQLKRLDDDKLMEEKGAEEVARSNVISNNAQTFIKTVNLSLKITELTKRESDQVSRLTKELGKIEDVQ